MTADELSGGDLKFQLSAQVYTPLLLCLSTAVREEDVGTINIQQRVIG